MVRKRMPAGPGRPKGKTCGHESETSKDGRHCRRTARVIVIIQMIIQGRARKYKVYRCFQHYQELEENARNISTMTIHRSELMDK